MSQFTSRIRQKVSHTYYINVNAVKLGSKAVRFVSRMRVGVGERQIERERQRETKKQRYREIQRQRYRDRDTETEIQRQRYRDRDTETETQRHRDTEKQRDMADNKNIEQSQVAQLVLNNVLKIP